MPAPRIYYGPRGGVEPKKQKPRDELAGKLAAPGPPAAGMGQGTKMELLNTQPATQMTLLNAQPATQPQTPTQTPTGIQPKPISPQVQELINLFKSQVNSKPITAEEIMQGAEYQDLAKGIQYQSDQAYAGMLKDAASRGAFGSKQAGLATAEMRGAFEAQKAGLVPQLLAAAEARRQTQLQNTASLLNTIAGLDATAFNQGLSEFQATAPYNMLTAGQKQQGEQFDKSFSLNEAAVTGQYMKPEVQQLVSAIMKAKQSWGNDNDGTTKAQDEAAANAARAQLATLGVNPALFGADVTYEQAMKNIGSLYTPTMANRQMTAGFTGIDPFTGQPTLQGRAAEQGLAMGALQYDVAANPQYGLAAQAQTDIANKQSLASNRTSGGGFTPYQQYQIDTDLLDREQKAHQQKAEQYTKTFDITPAGAESWMALEEALTQAKAQGISRDEAYEQFLGPILNNVHALNAKDRAFLYLLFQASYGDQNAAGRLETLKRGYKPPEADPLQGLVGK